MKSLIKLLRVCAILFCSFIALFIGFLHYLWGFRKAKFSKGVKWLHEKTNWVDILVN